MRCYGALDSEGGSTNEVAPFFDPGLPLVAGARFYRCCCCDDVIGFKIGGGL
jgi:hypothetical protein